MVDYTFFGLLVSFSLHTPITIYYLPRVAAVILQAGLGIAGNHCWESSPGNLSHLHYTISLSLCT